MVKSALTGRPWCSRNRPDMTRTPLDPGMHLRSAALWCMKVGPVNTGLHLVQGPASTAFTVVCFFVCFVFVSCCVVLSVVI